MVAVADIVRERLHINSVQASDALFLPHNRGHLRDVDAVCIDLDACIKDGNLQQCFTWIKQSHNAGLQTLVIGRRESFAGNPELQNLDVTFIERTGPLANASGRTQAEIVSKMLEDLYAPFKLRGESYVGSEDSFVDEQSRSLENSKKPIDRTYFQPVLTEEQDKKLLAFLRTPEGQDPPNDENA